MAKALLELAYPEIVLDIFLSKLDTQSRSEIKRVVAAVDHCAFIGTSRAQAESMNISLENIASQEGFPSDQQSFPSMILSRELGSQVGIEEIPTTVFKAQGRNSRGASIGIEVFLPEMDDTILNDWIARSIGTHIALRVKTPKGIMIIQSILLAQGFSMPAFMHNTPMENTTERSITIYFDIPEDDQHMRLEFFYKNNFLTARTPYVYNPYYH